MIYTKKGSVLVISSLFIAVLMIIGGAYVQLGSSEAGFCRREADSTKAFFLAESGIEQAMYDIKNSNISPAKAFTIASVSSQSNNLDSININITTTPIGSNQYSVTSSATVGAATRLINARVLKTPPALVFDYSYFINNWGWLYGSGITSNGDIRSNGRFDFQGGPTVNGDVYAGQGIGMDSQGVHGTGGQASHQHPNSPVEPMPNLQNLTYYENLAQTSNGKIIVGGVTLVNNVFTGNSGNQGSIVLVGTAANPIQVTGPVVIRGDVIIKGVVTGQGTIYSGRNIYVANNITYKNPPATARPASNDSATVDAWVNANATKDLVGFAAKQSIVVGDYTKTTHYGYNGSDKWYSDGYIFNMGSEDVGMDGIPGTHDTGEGDGVFQQAYEDLDGNGIFNPNYAWSDIATSVPVTSFSNLPGGVTTFTGLAVNNLTKVEGVLYTNHALAGKFGSNTVINGSVISKDEAMIYNGSLTFNHDERISSKYTSNPNWLINLNLPVATKAQLLKWWE